MAEQEYNQLESKKTNKFQWFVFVILIPLLFAVTFALIVMTIGGVNVFQKVQEYGGKIPVVSSMVSSDNTQENQEPQSAELQATVQDQNAQIQQLKGTVSQKNQTIEELNQQIEELTNQLNEKAKSDQQRSEIMKNMSSSFKEMDPEEAAPIIAQLDQSTAVSILQQMPDEERGNIFAKMSPEQAATLTSALVNNSNP
ncbi:hypothetical protein GLW08_01505 [Pontibacillus yanchengensis]|uniref:Magnesium transporter MgtE intracellular domain-containing protein n=2 Tax=Pontibacillus yanchengensis TaxID=462910 RepID=A0A6I4ZVH9_9BACI|nr:MotE family protein [Pontibacillus yanchengensis]MYL33144.1 hypothetical protein [Pontibacillus yanchengensis]MYL52006.1 hypothetical protein [Pontibacillus yanchengensis]